MAELVAAAVAVVVVAVVLVSVGEEVARSLPLLPKRLH